ncbi:MAG TPA: hypothetical protein VNT42_10275 [Sphingomonas sp.]|nr:hypothetical protein [Sphingomonas sp.]
MTCSKIATLLLITALPLAGCNKTRVEEVSPKEGGPKARVMSPVTQLMPVCKDANGIDVPVPTTVGGVRIYLPANLDLTRPPRRVKHFPAPYVIADAGDPATDALGQDNRPAHPPAGDPPFHIYLVPAGAPTTGFLAVQVIKRATTTTYAIYDAPGVPGVVAGDNNGDGALCSPGPVVGRVNRRQYTTFYVDLAKITAKPEDRSFNIGILPDAYGETPIFIDPKVRNDGNPT